MDMTTTIEPKSDQMNADDLIGGPRTITITRVSACPDADGQPVAVSYEGDGGKPYKPCKSMRRVMVLAWTANAAEYVGRSMTLYRDDKVLFGGMAVGGIRISHMSHIERDMAIMLTASKGKRAPYQIKRLDVSAARKLTQQEGTAIIDGIKARDTLDALEEYMSALRTGPMAFAADHPKIVAAVESRMVELRAPAEPAGDE